MKRKTVRKAKVPTAKKRGGKSKAARAKKPTKRHAPPVAPNDAIDGLVAASAHVLGLNIEPAWHGGVKFNLQLILRIGALVDEFPLPDDTEPAPVFDA
jgi:Protein of unknown function (DUF4089)